jgi:hypothetical protein
MFKFAGPAEAVVEFLGGSVSGSTKSEEEE